MLQNMDAEEMNLYNDTIMRGQGALWAFVGGFISYISKEIFGCGDDAHPCVYCKDAGMLAARYVIALPAAIKAGLGGAVSAYLPELIMSALGKKVSGAVVATDQAGATIPDMTCPECGAPLLDLSSCENCGWPQTKAGESS